MEGRAALSRDVVYDKSHSSYFQQKSKQWSLSSKDQQFPTVSYSFLQGRHCPTLAGMARVETPVSFAHLICFLAILSCFLPLCHRILPIVSPVFEIFKTPGMAIAIPAILVSPPLGYIESCLKLSYSIRQDSFADLCFTTYFYYEHSVRHQALLNSESMHGTTHDITSLK